MKLSDYYRRWLPIKEKSNVHLDRIGYYWDQLKNGRDDELVEAVSGLHTNAALAVDDEDRIHRLFAAVKEAVKRVLGFELHDVQLLGGLRMVQGHIVQMATGEGKTATAALPISWYALQHKGVHVMTANPYLAGRDYEQMKPVFELLGLSIGLNESGMDIKEKKRVYQQHITYGVFNEFGFDYLRDHLVKDGGKRVQRALSYAIVDEADSILIDEGKTPLLIAERDQQPSDWYATCANWVRGLKEDVDYERDAATKQVALTEAAIERAERFLGIDNLYDLANAQVLHILDQSLQAHVIMQRDVDYIVEGQTMKIIDSFTGRVLEGRLFNEGLHQAIEAKEQIPLSPENRVLGEISVQNFFSLYECAVGMTGTIKTDEEEIGQTYGLQISVIPTAKPIQRKDEQDLIFITRREKLDAVVQEINACHKVGQPVLIGTTTIAQSEELAARLTLEEIPFRLLNAKNEREEADIVANAGQRAAVTIATNMAGRGTDIQIGEGVAELGGLHVIGTERHESRRIDNQLRGRAGRKGEPGRSQFIVSLEDELIVRYGAEEADVLRSKLKRAKRGTDSRAFALLFKQAQQQAEIQWRETRSFLSRMDLIVHEQRKLIYAHRDELWQRGSLKAFLNQHVKAYIPTCTLPTGKAVSMEELGILVIDGDEQLTFRSKDALDAMLMERWTQSWDEALKSPSIQRFLPVWHKRYLTMLDRHWMKHRDNLKDMMWSVQYQAYAKEEPIQVFQQIAYQQFAHMQHTMTRKVGEWMLKKALPNLLSNTRRRTDGQPASNRSEQPTG